MLFLVTMIFTTRRCNALTIDSTYNPVLDLEISNPVPLVKLLVHLFSSPVVGGVDRYIPAKNNRKSARLSPLSLSVFAGVLR